MKRTLLVVTPNDLVEPRVAEQLQKKQESARHAQRATNVVPFRESVHHVEPVSYTHLTLPTILLV